MAVFKAIDGTSGISLEDKGVTFSSAYCTIMASSEGRISASSSCSPLFHGPSWDVYPMFRQAHSTYYNNIYIYRYIFKIMMFSYFIWYFRCIYIYAYIYNYIYITYIYISPYMYIPPWNQLFSWCFFQVDDPNMTDSSYGSRWVMGPSRDGAEKSLRIWDTLW